MPTYAYRCPNCGHEFQRFQKMSDRSRPRCPRCKSKTERVITGGAGLLFKGSGFYVTDYKKPKKGQEGQEGEKPSAPTEKKKPSPKKKDGD